MLTDGLKAIPIICGPTASGKSSLALDLCRQAGGELISCDSMQIYRGLDIGTAKATKEEQAEIPHHMIDVIDPGMDYSVNDYLMGCFAAIEDVLSRHKIPVICGGTGQYISSLKFGIKYNDQPVPDSLTEELYNEAGEKGIDRIYSELQKIDPEAAMNIHPNNIRRVIRAYSVYLATGKTFSQWNKESKSEGPRYPYVLIEYDYEGKRDVLYDRINKRVDIMMEEGLIDEVRNLYSLDVPHTSTCFQAIGYKEFAPYLNGDISLDKAVYDVKLNSRHYAKRQLTWFRYIDDIVKIKPGSSDAVSKIKSLILGA